MTTAEKEFQQWVKDNNPEWHVLHLEKRQDGDYSTDQTRHGWIAWQAARKLYNKKKK